MGWLLTSEGCPFSALLCLISLVWENRCYRVHGRLALLLLLLLMLLFLVVLKMMLLLLLLLLLLFFWWYGGDGWMV